MADEQQIQPTVPQPLQGEDITQTAANVTSAVQTVVNLKNHITQAVANAALKAGQEVRDEERRLKLLGAKVAGPFGRFIRALHAAVVAFLATWHAQA